MSQTLSQHSSARFQTYEDPPPPSATTARVAAIRDRLAEQGFAGVIIPRGDAHMGEYVAPHDERLAWATGFTGSAGMAVVMADRAAVFIDGRYTLQVRDQVDLSIFAPQHLIDEPPSKWLTAHVKPGDRIAYDPWLHTPGGLEPLEKAVIAAGGKLVAVETSPVDAAWDDQPAPPLAPVVPHPLQIAGEAAADKRARIAAALEGADAAVLTLPESIAWLLNIRGGDVGHVPLPHAFAVLHKDAAVDLYLDGRKVTEGLAAHLGNGVRLRDPAELGAGLDELAGKTVLGSSDYSVGIPPRKPARRSAGRRPHICRNRRRTPPNWPASAPRISATAPPSPASSNGSPKKARPAASARSRPARSWRISAAKPGR